MRPVNHTDSLEIPKPQHISHDVFLPADEIISMESDEEFIPPALEISESTLPRLINQCELNDLVRDLKLTKEQIECLGSRLKQWNLLEEGTKSSVFRAYQEDFSIYFEMYNTLCFCNNIDALMGALGVQHIPSEWPLFIDSFKSSIKAVLLQNGNLLPSIPIAYSENLRESHETMVILFEHIK